MDFHNIITFFLIIIINSFTHLLISNIFKNKKYDEKFNSGIVVMIVVGILCAIYSDKIKQSDKLYLKDGFKYSGILLFASAIFFNWDNFDSIIKMFILFISIFSFYYYTKN